MTVNSARPPTAPTTSKASPRPPAIGFARSQGVDVSELKVGEKKRPTSSAWKRSKKAGQTMEVLAGFLPDVIGRIPFQKKMRWGAGAFEFARPIHWIVALFGGEVIHFDAAGGVERERLDGSSLLAAAEAHRNGASRYVEEMRERRVIVDEKERMHSMKAEIGAIEAKTGAKAVADADLLERSVISPNVPTASWAPMTQATWNCPGRARQRDEGPSALHPSRE